MWYSGSEPGDLAQEVHFGEERQETRMDGWVNALMGEELFIN